MSVSMAGVNEVRLDASAGLIRVTVAQFWSATTNDDFLRRLEACIAEARLCADTVRVLIDARNLPVQSADVVATHIPAAQTVYRSDDRLAVVCSSTLAKLQFQRFLHVADAAYFRSLAEGEAWLRKG